jgi:hypothetical protein
VNTSGVVSAEHIEPSRRAFLARVHRTRGEELWEVRAETAIGALRVARHHFYTSRRIEVLRADGTVEIDSEDEAERDRSAGWIFSGFQSWQEGERSYQRTMHRRAGALPTAAVALQERLEGLGFSCTWLSEILRTTTVTPDASVTYGAFARLTAVRGDTCLTLIVSGSGSVDEGSAHTSATVGRALLTAAARLEPIIAGRGQKQLARQRAEALVAATSDVHDLVGSVEVSRATRGGRGGWKNKVARTAWSLQELLGMVAAERFDKFHTSIQ